MSNATNMSRIAAILNKPAVEIAKLDEPAPAPAPKAPETAPLPAPKKGWTCPADCARVNLKDGDVTTHVWILTANEGKAGDPGALVRRRAKGRNGNTMGVMTPANVKKALKAAKAPEISGAKLNKAQAEAIVGAMTYSLKGLSTAQSSARARAALTQADRPRTAKAIKSWAS